MNEKTSVVSKYDQLILVNVIEEFVRQKARETIKELGACDCKTCYLNVCAIALNNLPPKYVTTTRGALLSRITATEIGNSSAILIEVTKAVIQVKENPHHN
ncbi:MAG: late competence development ComFB family protein [Clostridiaceae bacterium]|nr:late competence development ComFB family protein [Clostridiaceae bacterium]